MKRILLSLIVGFVGIISFCSADKVSNLIDVIGQGTLTVEANSNKMLSTISNYGVYCVDISSMNAGNNYYYYLQLGRFSYPHEVLQAGNYLNAYWDQMPGLFCIYVNQPYIGFTNTFSYDISVNYTLYSLTNLLDTDIPIMSSLECQTEYNLIPIEDVNSNYCEINGLCPVCPEGTGAGFSNFYVRHGESTWSELTGTENYFVYLPDYLGFNYDYSNNGTDLNFTVGVSVDTGYINNVSAIQNSKPSQEDLNKLVSEVLPLFVPGLAVILLLYFIFRFIKKVF